MGYGATARHDAELKNYSMSFPTLKKFLIAASLLNILACQKQDANNTATEQVKDIAKSDANPTVTERPKSKQYSGPFGLAGSMTIAELEAVGFKPAKSGSEVFVGTPPKPLDGAKDYYVVATPKTGVCRIRVLVDVNVVNDSGDQLRSKTDSLSDMMQTKYGKFSRHANIIMQDVHRRNPQFWMLGLKEESIIYGYEWKAGKTEQALPDDIANIHVLAETSDLQSGRVVLQYDFKNFDECFEEMKKQGAAAL